MAQSLSGTLQVLLSMQLSGNIGMAAPAIAQAIEKLEADFVDGAGAGQAHQLLTAKARTLAASASESLELGSSGTLLDAFGNAIAMTKLKGLLVAASSGNTNDVLVGGDTNAALFLADKSDIVVLKPGGFFCWVAPTAGGVTMANGSSDTIKVANSAGTTGIAYDIAVWGA